MINEVEKPKCFRAICRYTTECLNTIPVLAFTKEEAEEKAKEQFERWNAEWISKQHGNPKNLIDITIQE